MEFSVHEYSSIQIQLRCIAELLVFLQDLPVESVDRLEILVCGVLMAVDFILNLAGCGRDWEHALYVKEVITIEVSYLFCPLVEELSFASVDWQTYVTVTDVLG